MFISLGFATGTVSRKYGWPCWPEVMKLLVCLQGLQCLQLSCELQLNSTWAVWTIN